MKTKTTTLLILTVFIAGLTLAQNTDMTEGEVKESVSEHIEAMMEIDQNNNQRIDSNEVTDAVVKYNSEDKYSQEIINTAIAANEHNIDLANHIEADLTREEARQAISEHAEALSQIDQNGDSSISQGEVVTAITEMNSEDTYTPLEVQAAIAAYNHNLELVEEITATVGETFEVEAGDTVKFGSNNENSFEVLEITPKYFIDLRNSNTGEEFSIGEESFAADGQIFSSGRYSISAPRINPEAGNATLKITDVMDGEDFDCSNYETGENEYKFCSSGQSKTMKVSRDKYIEIEFNKNSLVPSERIASDYTVKNGSDSGLTITLTQKDAGTPGSLGNVDNEIYLEKYNGLEGEQQALINISLPEGIDQNEESQNSENQENDEDSERSAETEPSLQEYSLGNTVTLNPGESLQFDNSNITLGEIAEPNRDEGSSNAGSYFYNFVFLIDTSATSQNQLRESISSRDIEQVENFLNRHSMTIGHQEDTTTTQTHEFDSGEHTIGVCKATANNVTIVIKEEFSESWENSECETERNQDVPENEASIITSSEEISLGEQITIEGSVPDSYSEEYRIMVKNPSGQTAKEETKTENQFTTTYTPETNAETGEYTAEILPVANNFIDGLTNSIGSIVADNPQKTFTVTGEGETQQAQWVNYCTEQGYGDEQASLEQKASCIEEEILPNYFEADQAPSNARPANSVCENLLSEALNGQYTYSSEQTGCVRR